MAKKKTSRATTSSKSPKARTKPDAAVAKTKSKPKKDPTGAKKAAPDNARALPEVTVVLTHDQIAERAYTIWLSKGRPIGCAREHWLQAERELAAKSV